MFILRKEVIQPLVPQRLPCYDFTLIINHTLGAYLPAPNFLPQLDPYWKFGLLKTTFS